MEIEYQVSEEDPYLPGPIYKQQACCSLSYRKPKDFNLLNLKKCSESLSRVGLKMSSKLGRGAYGVVYLYKDSDGVPFAIKFRKFEINPEDVDKMNIFGEGDITCICRNVLCQVKDCSQSIVNIYDVFLCSTTAEDFPRESEDEIQDTTYNPSLEATVTTVTEYIPGSFDEQLVMSYNVLAPYKTLLRAGRVPSSKQYAIDISIGQLKGFLYQIISALSILQNQIEFTHYDLKSDNVRLQNMMYDSICAQQYPTTLKDTSGYIAVIIDFGLARCIDPRNGEPLSGDNVVRPFNASHDLRFLGLYIVKAIPFLFEIEPKYQPVNEFYNLMKSMVYPFTFERILDCDMLCENLREESEVIQGNTPHDLLSHDFFRGYVNGN